MCISAGDVRAEEMGVFYDLLCPACQEIVDASEHDLFDLDLEECGFCEKCIEAIEKEIDEGVARLMEEVMA